MGSLSKYVNTTKRQAKSIPGRESEMVPNKGGGYSFLSSDWDILDRFLILGSETSYYASGIALTAENAAVVARCLDEDGIRAVDRIMDVSVKGLAPKNDPALFALAMAAGSTNDKTRKHALNSLPKVVRTGTHLFTFLEFVQGFRGWGRGLRKAIGQWYNQPAPDIAYQVIKYRNRHRWSHKDVLKMCHPKATNAGTSSIFSWLISGKVPENDSTPRVIVGYEKMKNAISDDDAISILKDFPNLPWETIPTKLLKSPAIWHELLKNLPATALLRNLGRMTSRGVFNDQNISLVKRKIGDIDWLQKSRIHPFSVLLAYYVYKSRCGIKGSLTWEPVRSLTADLENTFYRLFKTVCPTGKKILLAVDVSGSMGFGYVAGSDYIKPREAAAAMALITKNVEPNATIVGFDENMYTLNFRSGMSLSEAIRTISISGNATDCSAPIMWATKQGNSYDAIILYTDSATWSGNIHPSEAMEKYRQKINPDAKFICVSMQSYLFSVVDPKDKLGLAVVGFDANAPALISNFIIGDLGGNMVESSEDELEDIDGN